MISDVTSFNIPASNNEYKTVRICKVGVNATGTSDFAEIPNTTSTSSKLNTETKENMYYGDAGKSKRKLLMHQVLKLNLYILRKMKYITRF